MLRSNHGFGYTLGIGAYLMHPDTHNLYPARIGVGRSGLSVERTLAPSALDRSCSGPPLHIGWSSIAGFDADASRVGPNGVEFQALELQTDDGVLVLLVTAPDVSVLFGAVSRWSRQWHRVRSAKRPSLGISPIFSIRQLSELFLTRYSTQRGAQRKAQSYSKYGAQHYVRRFDFSSRFADVAQVIARHLKRDLESILRLVGPWLVALGRVVWITLGVLLSPFSRLLGWVIPKLILLTAPFRSRARRTLAWLVVKAAHERFSVVWSRYQYRRPITLTASTLAVILVSGSCLALFTSSSSQSAAIAPKHPATITTAGMAKLVSALDQGNATQMSLPKSLNLPAATSVPAPAPPSIADAPPLSPHEVFGFAPYWTLPQSSGFNVGGVTTLAYFSVGVNSDGTLKESGAGWNGYQSQELASLVTRAHGAGDRVVLTINDFSQNSLDQLTSSSTAAGVLSSALIPVIEAKNLDGVNLDFEGQGSADQTGLTSLVQKVSTALHAVNPHWQITMDTYASSAGDPNGFYNIAALSPWVDGFFVMAYQLNLSASSSTTSPMTSAMFSDVTTLEQYTSLVPASKVILGVPFYGINWPTSDGTLSAQPTGSGTPIAYAQIVAGGTPIYWDNVTNTAWTSYQIGSQWYETFFEDPTSLYMEAQLAQQYQIAGMGIWALGMDGNDPNMLAAVDGFSPAIKNTASGPTSTSTSSSATSSTPASGTTSSGSGSSSSPTLPGSTSVFSPLPGGVSILGSGSGSGSASGSGSGSSSGAGSSSGSGTAGGTSGSVPTSTTTTTTTTTSTTTTTTTVPPSSSSGSTGASGSSPSGSGTGSSASTSSGNTFSGSYLGHLQTLVPVDPGQFVGIESATSVGTLSNFQTTDTAYSCLSTDPSLNVYPDPTTANEYIAVAVVPTDCVSEDFTFTSSAS